MRAIPKKLRDELEADPWYQQCCLTKLRKGLGVKIEWHHNLIYAGKQVNEKFCILPLEAEFHRRANEKWVKDCLDHVMLNRATDEELRRYSKAVDLVAKRNRLNIEHGTYKENKPVLHPQRE